MNHSSTRIVALIFVVLGIGVLTRVFVDRVSINQSINQPANQTPKHFTRGLQSQQEINQSSNSIQTPMIISFGSFMQTPVSIDGRIPLWSILVALAGLIATLVKLGMMIKSHEELDKLRFDALGFKIDELRKELKENSDSSRRNKSEPYI